MRRRAEPGVDHHRHRGLLHDDPHRVARAHALVRADPRSERHDGGASRLLESLGQHGVRVDVREHGEPVGHELLRGPQRLHRIRQEVAGLRRHLELHPRRHPRGAREASDPHGLLRVHRARRIRQQQVPIGVDELEDFHREPVVDAVPLRNDLSNLGNAAHGLGNIGSMQLVAPFDIGVSAGSGGAANDGFDAGSNASSHTLRT